MASNDKVASPSSSKAIQLKDSEVGFSYIEFPEDTFFLESLAQNAAYKPGVAYVPAQRFVNGEEQSHLYEITASSKEAKHIAGPVAAPGGSTDVTIFGSALNSKGILFLCAFNRNSIITLDLNKLPDSPTLVECDSEIEGLASPNDVCIDPKNESILYTAGGTFRNLCCCIPFSNSAYGVITKIELKDNGSYTKMEIADGLKTLAGIEVIGDELWVAQLYNIVKKKQASSGKETTIAWRGNDGKGQVWLADNIDTFDGKDILLCPAYATQSESVVDNLMKRSWAFAAVLFYFQMSTMFMRGEHLREALRDPEVSLSFSNTYIQEGEEPKPIMLLLMNCSDGTACHFEIDLEQTRAEHEPREIKDRSGENVLGKREFFNEQVTHAGHLVDQESGKGFIACVNFEQPRILLLSDAPFRVAMNT